ncbi:hypothetical protein [Paenibacillus sp. OK003]|uniref:DUF6115 domain-containing protein n=1 Tax=Paenibacillus sp. OK003 TaxID=1884380 RepID=UPI0008BF71DC|nr:hypothetical protein [Paenibacillus sp. OK003]SEK21967.1 hypothetical protein SAMN05518856_101132 [Paenibacillus sp. OK003]
MSPWIIIVILGACAIAYAFIMPKKNKVQEPGHHLVQEMESTLEHYMAEIENDNDALIQRVAEMKGEATAADQRMQSQLQELQRRLDQLEESKTTQTDAPSNIIPVHSSSGLQAQALVDSVRADSDSAQQVSGAEEQAAEQESKPARESIKDRYAELFNLYAEGKSVDAIAKQTGIQRGEVQLILQLAEREES